MTLPRQEIEALKMNVHEVSQFLENVDYGAVRRELGTLGAAYHNIRDLSTDPAPASLRMGVNGFTALRNLMDTVNESGLLEGIGRLAPNIRRHVSRELLPWVDAEIIDNDDRLDAMIKAVRGEGRGHAAPPDFNVETLAEVDPLQIANLLVVDIHQPDNWENRPRVTDEQQAHRLRIAAAMTAMFAGGLSLGVNVALGVFATSVSAVPAVVGNVPTILGIVASTTMGLNSVRTGLLDLAAVVEESG